MARRAVPIFKTKLVENVRDVRDNDFYSSLEEAIEVENKNDFADILREIDLFSLCWFADVTILPLHSAHHLPFTVLCFVVKKNSKHQMLLPHETRRRWAPCGWHICQL